MNEVIEHQARNMVAMPAPAADSPMGMMLAALQHGATLEQVEKMMDLQQRYDDAQAKKAYDKAFAAFKAEAVQIMKGKKVTDGPLKGKSYAELHDVVDAATPALSKHGLSSSWKLTKDEPTLIEVTCYLRHVEGHQESVSMSGPPDVGGAKNAIQARASTVTYLERYTLKAITGLSETNDDTDGNAVKASGQEQSETPAKDSAKNGDAPSQRLVNHNALVRDKFEIVSSIKTAIAKKDYYEMALQMDKLSEDEKTTIWMAPSNGGVFTTAERAAFKSNEYNSARADYFAEKQTKQEKV